MEGRIIDINKNKEHNVSEAICIECGHRWIAVRPKQTLLKQLECPNCENSGYVIETGEEMEKSDDL